MEPAAGADELIEALLEREGGYVRNSPDGAAACFGVSEAVARAHGYAGAMRQLPRDEAAAIYRRLYWLRPRFDEIAKRSARIAAERFDTGANMGPAVAATLLQRALTALNRNGGDYPDLVPDGRIAERTLGALDDFMRLRGNGGGEAILLRAIEALRVSATCAWPNAARPRRPIFTAGWRAASAMRNIRASTDDDPAPAQHPGHRRHRRLARTPRHAARPEDRDSALAQTKRPIRAALPRRPGRVRPERGQLPRRRRRRPRRRPGRGRTGLRRTASHQRKDSP